MAQVDLSRLLSKSTILRVTLSLLHSLRVLVHPLTLSLYLLKLTLRRVPKRAQPLVRRLEHLIMAVGPAVMESQELVHPPPQL